MNSRSLSVRALLLITFGSLGLLVVLVATGALLALSQANGRFENYVRGINARAMTANAVRSAVERRAVAIRNMALVDDAQQLASEREIVLAADTEVKKNLERLEQMAQTPDVPKDVRQKIAAIGGVEREYSPIAKEILSLLVANNRDEAVLRIRRDCRPRLVALAKTVDDYLEFTAARQETQIASIAKEYTQQRAELLAACVLTFIFATAAGLVISRQLTKALGAEPSALCAAAERVASGDLSSLPGAHTAPQGSVMSSLGAMQQSLAKVVRAVRDASNSIATGSAEIAIGNADLSQRTEQQASRVQQTASSMEQMTVSVASNAETARTASEIATAASVAASGGGQAMTSVASKMGDISASSRKIGDIIGVIDGIAFQTNILSLNAAVEAARAGEQGRGFAVVASEVRSLAHRSADAAKEIKALIERSAGDVEMGEELVAGAGKAMEQIVDRVRSVSALISEISQASTAQRGDIGEVSGAMGHLDQTTQQNAALVEESAAAAESLREQASKLSEVVSVFRLE